MKTLRVRVRPGAAKTRMAGELADGTLKIDIAAAPEDGKANIELVRFLADHFGVSRAGVEILSGQTGRKKLVRVDV